MLKVCRRGDVTGSLDLTPEEDHAVRAAFRRFAKPEARSSGSVVVRRYQHSGFDKLVPMRSLGGNWSLSRLGAGPGNHHSPSYRAALARTCGWVRF
jgi:hypothetical protein